MNPGVGFSQQVEVITAIIKPSRSLFGATPFGLTFGDVGEAKGQQNVLANMLPAANDMNFAGIRNSGIVWTKDDMRYRQLRKIS